MEATTLISVAIGASIVIVKILDKAMPTTGDVHLKAIAESNKEMLSLQRTQREESRVDRERLIQIQKSSDRLESRLERHVADEDKVHRTLVDQLNRGNGVSIV